MKIFHTLNMFLRRISLTVKMLLATIIMGLVVWSILDAVLTRTVSEIFKTQLYEKLNEQALAYRYRFSHHVNKFREAAKLFVNLKNLVDYIEKEEWQDQKTFKVKIDTRPPDWFIKRSIQRTFIAPHYAILLDSEGRVRDIYQNRKQPLPPILTNPNKRLLNVSLNERYLISIDGAPYLITSASIKGSKGTIIGYLQLVNQLDKEFLISSQNRFTKGIVMALVEGEKQEVIVSSNSELLPVGSNLENMSENLLSTGQEFFEYGSSEMDFKFAFLVSTSELEGPTNSFVSKARWYRGIMALTFILAFALIMFWITQRIKKLTDRIELFSKKALGGKGEASGQGDQLNILEQRFIRLTQEVEESHKTIRTESEKIAKRTEELGRKAKQIELLQSVTEAVGIGVMIRDENGLHPANKQMVNYFSIFKDMNVFDIGKSENEEKILVAPTEQTYVFHIICPDTSMEEKIILAIDITQRKQAENEIKSVKNYLNDVINSMPSVLIGVDMNLLVTHWNYEAEKLTSIPQRAAIAQPVDMILPNLSNQMGIIKNAIKNEKLKKMENVMISQKGEHHYLDIMIYPLSSTGIGGAVLRMDDVTEKVKLQEMVVQSEKMMSIGGLAAGTAHEINNPLSGILQSAQVVDNRFSADLEKNRKVAKEFGIDLKQLNLYMEKREINKFLDHIKSSTNRAARIVKNMLQFSRPGESSFEFINLPDLIDNTIEIASSDYDLKKKYDFRHIKISREFEPDFPLLQCIGTEIEQVILNLLKNAAQAMADQVNREIKPQINIRLKKQKFMARIELEDNGPGISEKNRKRIFEPFFTTKPVGIGTGLGLSVSYFIITKNHHGTMVVDSKNGRGTKFTIRIPYKDSRTDHPGKNIS